MRIALSWVCYWFGDRVEHFFGNWNWGISLYQTFMRWSDTLQGTDPRGPWLPGNFYPEPSDET